MRVLELFGAQGGTALLALVAVCIRVSAAGAGAGDVAVGQEDLGLGVEILFRLPGYEFPVIIELAEELRGVLAVDLRRGT